MTPAISPRLAGVGRRIRTARGDAGISLSRLALEAGIGKGTLSELEQGTRNPTLETLYAVAGVLEVPLALLVAGEGKAGERNGGEGNDGERNGGERNAEGAVVRGTSGVDAAGPGEPYAGESCGTGSMGAAEPGGVVVADPVVRVELLQARMVPGGALAEVYWVTLSPGRRVSPGHGRGVREQLTLLAGAAVVGPEGAGVILGPGESTSWDSSVSHCYETTAGAEGVLIITNPARDGRSAETDT